ncbi:MAG: ATP-binding protein [Coleofasciculaceae cyanobacterium]
MATIDQILQREVNPFDPVTFKSGNFWAEEEPERAFTVESIHQETIDQIARLLAQVARDHRTRTLMLAGDSGSGKSYLLGRLKRALNPKAFFAYIGPWPESDHIWRHTLRYTIDSLMYTPVGQTESQLLLWLKSRSVFKQRSLMKKLLGEKGLFISNFKAAYPAGVYNANAFFSALYHLTQPESYHLACEWLKGDDLDEDSLKALGVSRSIDSEDAAQKILSNFGRVSAKTQPIVLCFDQVEMGARLPDGSFDLQPVFSVNTTFHNENLKNFLIIISIVTDIWKLNGKRIEQSDKARIEKLVRLKPITLEQAESLWESRLYPLHRQANPQPQSPIYPLHQQSLEQKFPNGKTYPRKALELGRRLLLQYKTGIETVGEDQMAAFKLLWHKEFKKTQQKVSRMGQFSSPELIRMLRKALAALQMVGIKPQLLPSSTYASYSFSYQKPNNSDKLGIVWIENSHMVSFFHVMNACQKAIKQNLCQNLHLIRAEGVGKPRQKGHKLYEQIFTSSPHRHIKPDLKSVHYLATYDSLVNAACSGELVVAGNNPGLTELETLIRDSQILDSCPLLQELGLVTKPIIGPKPQPEVNLLSVKEFVLNLVKTQKLMGRQILIQSTDREFSEVNESQIKPLIEELCQERRVQILDPNAKPEEQLVCLVP